MYPSCRISDLSGHIAWGQKPLTWHEALSCGRGGGDVSTEATPRHMSGTRIQKGGKIASTMVVLSTMSQALGP